MLKELLEKRAKLAAEIYRMRDLVKNEKRPFSADERTAWDKVNAEYNDIGQQITIAQRGEQIEKEDREYGSILSTLGNQAPKGAERIEGVTTEEHRELAFRGWCAERQGEDATDAQIQAAKRVGLGLHKHSFEIPRISPTVRSQILNEMRNAHPNRHQEIVQRALSATTPDTGAYTILPVSFLRSLEINMLYYGGVEAESETITTSTGEPMMWPTADDTSNAGVQLSENTATTTTAQPAFGAVVWNAYKFTSKGILVPSELLQDSQFDLSSILGQMLGERLGRIANTKFTLGTGAGTVKGLTVAASTGFTTASATAITADELIKASSGSSSIDPAYRSQGFKWMAHDNVWTQVRYLKDGIGRYMWQSGLDTGMPDRLLGYPIVVNQDMQSSLATGTITFLYGLFKKYKVRRVGGTRFFHLGERYRDTDQDGFFAFQRFDGNLLTSATAVVKKITQA